MKANLILAVTVMLAAACPAWAADVKDNWTKHCAKCHGADGKGQTVMGKKLKAKDYTDAKVQAEFTDEEAIKSIAEGKKDGDKTIKKGFKDTLSEQEIKDLVAHVRAFKK